MNRRNVLQGIGAAMMLSATSGLAAQAAGDDTGVVYELRIYHTYEGKLEPLLKRFREQETKIFERLGMHGVGYWTPDDEPLKGRTLIYMLRQGPRVGEAEGRDGGEWAAGGEARYHVHGADRFFSEGLREVSKQEPLRAKRLLD